MILYAIIHASLMFLGYGMWCHCMHVDPPEDGQRETAMWVLIGIMVLAPVFTPLMFVVMAAVVGSIGFRLKP